MGFQWRRTWWVLAFSLSTGWIYLHSMSEKKVAIREVSFRLVEMEKERFLALREKEDLQLRIHSQTDPAWIEMILMRDLGVVPEGFLKVHFRKP